MIEPSIFSTVELGTWARSPASPVPPRRFKGLLLRTPTRITLTTDDAGQPLVPVVIPVCGFHRLEVPPTPITEREQIVVRPRGGTQEFRGTVVDTDPSPIIPPPPAPHPTPAMLAGVIASTHFNVDLTQFVDVPVEVGEYSIWFEFRGQRSNTEILEIALATTPGGATP